MYDDKVRYRFWSHVDILENVAACWLWTGAASPLGYGRFNVGRIDGKKRTRVSSRVAWELTHGQIPPGQHVLHRCDNPPCVNPAHLFLGTDADNIHDCIAKGRFRPQPHYGNDNAAAKITPEDVRAIRKAYSAGARSGELAKRFGIHGSTILRIAQRRTWTHVA